MTASEILDMGMNPGLAIRVYEEQLDYKTLAGLDDFNLEKFLSRIECNKISDHDLELFLGRMKDWPSANEPLVEEAKRRAVHQKAA